ncbi:SSI family serine proteinase inhibitor [Saccharopolyspora sp. K220]|uniref:SSI family serine proteinase inhibitor n=1 Tax=Saccharopolyspora soli TaxID=2926618 RepID=UPI001F56F5D4|nr:SSI family serine proteinase inhibitor [Saccharopolyspora soli]MCI2416711.1 SSI family serine proteinase inhibitor [Saccharopolyspora soli]
MAATRLIARTFLASAMLASTALAPALANAEPAASGSMMNLTVRSEMRGDDFRTALLTCEPAGGSHPHASAACQTLDTVHGDLNLLSEGHSMCPLVYKPVKLAAKGSWQGRPVTFEKTYSNDCVAEAATGKVFAF